MWSEAMRKKAKTKARPNNRRPIYTGPRILRLPAVLAFSGYGKSQLDEKIKAGEFPAPIKLSDSGRAVGWLEEELTAWREARKAKRSAA
jgi:predicted DNA-binding transcriptional regulator AlpA